jgi:RNA polymerase sigma-70 factor, ECF subfamily
VCYPVNVLFTSAIHTPKLPHRRSPERGCGPTIERDATTGGTPSPLSETFVAELTGAQRPLFAYIRSLVGPWASPEDILQEVNLVLCHKASEFDGRGRFLTWACRVAYLQVLAHLKQRQRDRSVYMDETVLADLAGPLAERVEQFDDRLDVLRRCLARLSPAQQRMITARYTAGGSVQKVADAERRPVGSIRVTLHRIRQLLLECVDRNLNVQR